MQVFITYYNLCLQQYKSRSQINSNRQVSRRDEKKTPNVNQVSQRQLTIIQIFIKKFIMGTETQIKAKGIYEPHSKSDKFINY